MQALRRRGEAVPRVVATLVGLVGLATAASAVTPARWRAALVTTEVFGDSVTNVAVGTTAALGVGLVLLSGSLRRRQRSAWRAALLLAATAGVLHLVKGLDVLEAGVAFGLVAVLLASRTQFRAAPRGGGRRAAAAVLAGLLLADVALGMVLLLGSAEAIAEPDTWGLRLQHVLLGLVGVSGPLHFTSRALDTLVYSVLAALGGLTLLTGLVLLLRPPGRAATKSAAEQAALATLLAEHGDRDSLSWFATRDDRSLILSPSGKAAVSYRVVGGIALAAGDPLGDPEAWPPAQEAFLAAAADNAWIPGVMGCSEPAGRSWAKLGLDALELGDEAVVDTASFSLEGRAMRGVRQAVARVERAGYRCEIRRARDVPEQDWQQVCLAAQRWREGTVERGFSMALGRLADPRDGEGVLVTALDSTGDLRALLHFVPWGRVGLSLDVMRRDRAADNGLNETMIANLLLAAPQLGVQRVSLNFAVFRAALERGSQLGAGPFARFWRRILLIGSRWWQIEQLYRFNAKFGPEWVPRYLCYPGSRELLPVVLGALRAEAFIVAPAWSQRFRR